MACETPDLAEILTDLYDSDLPQAAEWLRANAVQHYPDSDFARKHARGFE